MCPDFWEWAGLAVAVASLYLTYLGYRATQPRAFKRETIVVRDRELRIGSWLQWKSRTRKTYRS